MEAILIISAIGYTIVAAFVVWNKSKKIKSEEGYVPTPGKNDKLQYIPIRKMDSICYGMVNDEISELTIKGIRIHYRVGYYNRNEPRSTDGWPTLGAGVFYFVSGTYHKEPFAISSRDLFDSKEELIKHLETNIR